MPMELFVARIQKLLEGNVASQVGLSVHRGGGGYEFTRAPHGFLPSIL